MSEIEETKNFVRILQSIPLNGYNCDWNKFKGLLTLKKPELQYLEEEHDILGTVYLIWFEDGNSSYYTIINDLNNFSEVQDFENNFKPNTNKTIEPKTEDGKLIVRAESRPIGLITAFVSKGDSDTKIGDGKLLAWDFSNENDIVSMSSGSGLKRKRIEFKFLDDIYLKDGAVYFFNAKKGSYGDVYMICPAGQFYLKNDGTPTLAIEDTIISHYLVHMMIQGDCPMGNEFNTESCSEKLPNNYKFRIEITVPDDDNNSNGYISLEIFRERTVIL